VKVNPTPIVKLVMKILYLAPGLCIIGNKL